MTLELVLEKTVPLMAILLLNATLEFLSNIIVEFSVKKTAPPCLSAVFSVNSTSEFAPNVTVE